MTLLDFTIEFQSDVPTLSEDQKLEIETRLRSLADEREDITGAAVAVTQPARTADPFIYQVRIVAYMRPDDVVAVKKDETIQGAMKAALDAVERQVREQRKKLREPWKRPDIPGTPAE